MHPKWVTILALFALLTAHSVALAQSDSDAPRVLDITYDSVVEDTITDRAFWDWWIVQASSGDVLVIDMAAGGGLAPLIGILDASGTLVARSDDGAPNATIRLEYTAPANDRYTIVATRVGNEQGTTSGSYTLRLRRANPVVEQADDRYQDVTFRCEGIEVTTAATLRFGDDPRPDLVYRITVYGVDGFRPVIRINFNTPQGDPFELCNTDARYTIGDTFILPGEPARTITEETIGSASQLLISGADQAGVVRLTIASAEGVPGRWMAVIDGFRIEPAEDTDLVEVRVGPLAARDTGILTYMVGGPSARLDPFMTNLDVDESCDDAGRDGCDAVPSFTGAGVTLNEGAGLTLRGDRSDAGLLVQPRTPDPVGLELRSRSGRTRGDYALILIGELPPRQ